MLNGSAKHAIGKMLVWIESWGVLKRIEASLSGGKISKIIGWINREYNLDGWMLI